MSAEQNLGKVPWLEVKPMPNDCTPGPWHLHDMESNTVCGSDHLAIADCNASSRAQLENEDNARLIASAPDLYEALDNCVNGLGCQPGYVNTLALQRAKQALASARGETTEVKP